MNVNRSKSAAKRKSAYVMSLISPTTSIGVETHIIMKDNAMFLLELASSAETGMNHQRRPSSTAMPSLSENNSTSPPDYSSSFFPVPPPFQCLQSLGADPAFNDAPFYEEVLKRHSAQEGFGHISAGSGQRVEYFFFYLFQFLKMYSALVTIYIIIFGIYFLFD